VSEELLRSSPAAQQQAAGKKAQTQYEAHRMLRGRRTNRMHQTSER
jgi:hypothetical protein